jgi:hypothetical protein
MKNIFRALCCLMLIVACDSDGLSDSSAFLSDIAFSGGTGDDGGQDQAGIVTAGEWNDLDNWQFWRNLFQEEDYREIPSLWSIYNHNRIDVLIKNQNQELVNNAKVELIDNNQVMWIARTDNFGKAVLWLKPYESGSISDYSNLELRVNDIQVFTGVTVYRGGANTLTIHPEMPPACKIELSFIVDATGSMGDELEFLKSDLQNVISRVQRSRANSEILLSTVFYRDDGDDYVTRSSGFTTQVPVITSFINAQQAGGGGDYPEAVHKGFEVALNEFQWSQNASTRIIFLLLDAPPHNEVQILEQIRAQAKKAAQLGIKIIPIGASGIDKPTEFLSRNLAQLTNGTYVFITNDSGVGDDHLEPTVGDYEVELLNDLMVRLIEKYSQE